MFDFTELAGIATRIVHRIPVTLWILVFSAAFGLLFGLLLAIVRIRKPPVLHGLATLYISFMRCTPTLVQLFLVFYGLPMLLALLHIDASEWSATAFAIITLALHSAAYFSEVIRSSYLAVGSQQQEAAYSVGMSYMQSLRRIILPQAWTISLPVMGNNIIRLLKETSLVFSIGIADMMGQAQIIIANNYGTNILSVYVIISIIYWLISILIGRIIAYMEARGSRSGGLGMTRP